MWESLTDMQSGCFHQSLLDIEVVVVVLNVHTCGAVENALLKFVPNEKRKKLRRLTFCLHVL